MLLNLNYMSAAISQHNTTPNLGKRLDLQPHIRSAMLLNHKHINAKAKHKQEWPSASTEHMLNNGHGGLLRREEER